MRMGCLRMRTTLRYGHIFRLGAFNYVLFILVVVAVWTSVRNLTARRLTKVDGSEQASAQHVHRKVQDISPRFDDILVVRPNRPKPETVFAHKSYPSNFSQPVKVQPPIADPPPPPPAVGQGPVVPCPVVRVVEFFGQPLYLRGDPLCSWLANPKSMADGRFVLYGGSKMALLYDVTVDSTYRAGKGAQGGEKMEEVWGQSEESEYLKLKEGYFTLQCSSPPSAAFDHKDHLSQWMQAVRCSQDTVNNTARGVSVVKGLTIAVQRYEYVNLYHTMTDFYNAFLTMLMFNQNPDDVTVLWVDAHPQGGLDVTWDALFGKVMRAGSLPSNPMRFSALAWAAMGYNSPLNEHSRPSVDYLEEFRHFFLSRHGVDGGRAANCSALSWLFIWRRDYAAHPRNKGGSIKRKIDNEEELLVAMREVLAPGDSVRGLQLDSLSMQDQLGIIAQTDVLLGMHGAGLSHTLFLPPHGGLLEFYPTYWPQANKHFRAMATWRGLHYQNWQNHDSANEKKNYRTYIPPQVLVRMVKEMRKNICG